VADKKPDLLTAAIGLRDDLLMRAEFDDDATAVVCAGNGVWFRFNQAIDAMMAEKDRRDER
jgi:hypothetical protein